MTPSRPAPQPLTRRAFLQRAASVSTLGAAVPLGLTLSAITQASAQSTGGYRALVCVFLSGGNDAFNTVLATDPASWGHYLAHRRPIDGSSSIALMEPGTAPNPAEAEDSPLRLGGVLPISHSGRAEHAGRQFALHPALPRLRQLYQDGRAAVVANVGPLTRPTTKADWSSPTASKPIKLFSHNDQQSTWQSFEPEGAPAGWGGRLGDALMAQNGAGLNAQDAGVVQRMFTCMSPTGGSIWLAGSSVLPYQSSTTGIQALGSGGRIYGSTALQASVQSIMAQQQAAADRSLFMADHQQVVKRALVASDLLGSRLAPLGIAPWSSIGNTNPYNDNLLKYTSPIDGSLKTNSLAVQLQMVARLIQTSQSSSLGMGRQFFMVSLGGFDFHDNQISDQADKLAMLDHALGYFDTVLGSMPQGDMRNQVTTFTASEFGRTFTSNGDGTDHGWGAHQFVMGGSVQGGEVYGTFPQYSTANAQGVFSSPDQIQNGILIPTTSVDHLAYTLGRWMGVSDGQLLKSPSTPAGLLPNLNQFSSAGHNLGFMRA